MVQDYCGASQTHAQGGGWADGVFMYKSGTQAALVCIAPTASGKVTIAQLHVYGSAPKGLYLHNHSNTPDDPFTDTPLRVRRGMEHFVAQFGHAPDVMVRSTVVWDAALQKTLEPRRWLGVSGVAAFASDVRGVMTGLRALLPPTTLLAVRTAPSIYADLPDVGPRNAALRRLGWQETYAVLDWAQQLDGRVDHLRDTMHPKAEFTAVFGREIARLAVAHVRATAAWSAAAAQPELSVKQAPAG
jgi:hypothetical protein